jgi:hypothetical protein
MGDRGGGRYGNRRVTGRDRRRDGMGMGQRCVGDEWDRSWENGEGYGNFNIYFFFFLIQCGRGNRLGKFFTGKNYGRWEGTGCEGYGGKGPISSDTNVIDNQVCNCNNMYKI